MHKFETKLNNTCRKYDPNVVRTALVLPTL